MKKILAFVLTITLALGLAVSASAKPRHATKRRTAVATRSNAHATNDVRYEQRDDRSFWEKHRDKLTIAAGAVGGGVLGGMLGGKKGAAIGAIAGGVGGGVYTYKIRKKESRY
jgi:outer membrane lipoprotein SlyB